MCVCVRARVCVGVCVCVRVRAYSCACSCAYACLLPTAFERCAVSIAFVEAITVHARVCVHVCVVCPSGCLLSFERSSLKKRQELKYPH